MMHKNLLQIYHRTKCISVKTMKFLEENIGVKFCDLGLDSAVLVMTPKTKITLTSVAQLVVCHPTK